MPGSLIRDLQVHVPPSLTDTCQLRSLSRKRDGVSILGHLQPYKVVVILACERLLPVVNQPFNVAIPNRRILNGCFHQQQSFNLLGKPFCEGLESAKSGRWSIIIPTSNLKILQELSN